MNWLVGAATIALLGTAVLLIAAVVVRAVIRLRRAEAGWPREPEQPRYDPPAQIPVPQRPDQRAGPALTLAIGWVWFCAAAIAGAGWLVREALADTELTWPYRSAAIYGGMTAATLLLLLVAVPPLPEETRGDVVKDGVKALLVITPVAAVLAYLMREDPAEMFAVLVAAQLLAVTDRIIAFVVDR
jgi:hypothetical protein